MRPFLFLGSIWAVLLVPVWLLILSGAGPDVDGQLGETAWHAHELLFGFAGAVIAGAVLHDISPKSVALLGALWLAGRVVVMAPVPPMLARVVDLAFVPALALATLRRRDIPVLIGLAAYALSDFAIWSPEWRARGLRMAVDAVMVLLLVLTGRRSYPVIGAILLATLADAAFEGTYARTTAYAIAAVAVAVWAARQAGPWIVRAGHAFVAIGFAMRALPVFVGVISDSAATHAFTVGALGCMAIGLMTDGRSRWAAAAIACAAVVRVVAPHFAATYVPGLFVAGALWTIAFVTVVARALVRWGSSYTAGSVGERSEAAHRG